MVMCPMTSCEPKRPMSCPTYTWIQICRKPLEIEARFQRTTNRMSYRESNGHVIEFKVAGWRGLHSLGVFFSNLKLF